MKRIAHLILGSLISSCASSTYDKTVEKVDKDRFMGKWYVQAGRFTALEKDPYNSTETYIWNEKEKRIDVDFRFNKGSPDGEEKKIPQKAWIDSTSGARWKVQPFWPLKFDYLVIGLADDYSWTAIGVPNEKYLWVMSRDPAFPRTETDRILKRLKSSGYDIRDIQYVTHSPQKDSRTLVIRGRDADPAVTSALRKLEKYSAGLEDRDLEIRRESAREFELQLIGKDGGEKWTSEDPNFEVSEVFERVDAMPMRQVEMEERRSAQ